MDRVSLLRIGNRKLTNDTMSGNKSLLLQDVSQKYCAKSQIQIAKYDKKHSMGNTARFPSCKIIFIQIYVCKNTCKYIWKSD